MDGECNIQNVIPKHMQHTIQPLRLKLAASQVFPEIFFYLQGQKEGKAIWFGWQIYREERRGDSERGYTDVFPPTCGFNVKM